MKNKLDKQRLKKNAKFALACIKIQRNVTI